MVKTSGVLSYQIGITHGLNLACFVFEVILLGLFWLVGLFRKIGPDTYFKSNSDLMGPNRHFIMY